MKCKTNYYTVDGNDCIPCPESSIGQWSIAIGIILVCIFLLYKILEEKQSQFDEEDDEEEEQHDNNHAKNAKKGNNITRQNTIESFRKGG